MSWPHIAIYAVVGCIGLPAMFRNPTAAALTLSWMLGEVTWMATGNNLPLSVYFMADVAVITIIYAKMIWRVGPKTYPSAWLHFKCFILDLTIYDRIIVGIFLLGEWPAYVLELDPYYKWYLLWALTISQFLSAGAESAISFWRSRSVAWGEAKRSRDFPVDSSRFGKIVIPAQIQRYAAMTKANSPASIFCVPRYSGASAAVTASEASVETAPAGIVCTEFPISWEPEEFASLRLIAEKLTERFRGGYFSGSHCAVLSREGQGRTVSQASFRPAFSSTNPPSIQKRAAERDLSKANGGGGGVQC